MKRKILVAFMVMSLSLSMIGCGGEAEPADDSKVSSESVSGEKSEDVISGESESDVDVQPEVEVEDDEKEDSDAGSVDSEQPEVTEPEVTEPEVTEPEVTEPEVVEPEPEEDPFEEPAETPVFDDELNAYRVENLQYPFEGIYWVGKWRDYYFDGKNQIEYYTSGGKDETGYVVEGNTFTTDYGETYEWWIEEENLVMCLAGETNEYYHAYYTPITEEEAIEQYPDLSEEPEEVFLLEEVRVENLTYEFEGVYWLTEYGSVIYFDGTYMYSYDDAGNESKKEYAATDRTYEYVGADFSFRWYMYENNFYFWLDGGEMGGDSGALEMRYTPISKEKAMELCPAIGGEVVEETPETETACDFEDKYWLDDEGKFYHHYSNGKETRVIFDVDTYYGTYVVNGNVITIDRDGFIVEFNCWIEDGNLYMEPAFTDGFGGETMVFTETTEEALAAATD